MHESAVSKVYAKAIMDLASDAGVIDNVSKDLHSFLSLMDTNSGLKDALTSPVFTMEERQAVLDGVLPKCGFHALTNNVLRLANEKGRLPVVDAISASFDKLVDEKAGRVKVQVATAEPMTPQIEAEVRAALSKTTGKDVILDCTVDPTLLGGIVARVGGTVYDSSVRTRLERLKQTLMRAPAVVAEA